MRLPKNQSGVVAMLPVLGVALLLATLLIVGVMVKRSQDIRSHAYDAFSGGVQYESGGPGVPGGDGEEDGDPKEPPPAHPTDWIDCDGPCQDNPFTGPPQFGGNPPNNYGPDGFGQLPNMGGLPHADPPSGMANNPASGGAPQPAPAQEGDPDEPTGGGGGGGDAADTADAAPAEPQEPAGDAAPQEPTDQGGSSF